jgi:hypothetical protein
MTMAINRFTRPLLGAICACLAAASLAADRVTILSEGDTSAYWRPVAETQAMPGYPRVVADKTEDVCISIGYMLQQDGTTSDHALVSAWSSADQNAKSDDRRFIAFAQKSLAAIQHWRFTPAAGTGVKVRPVYTATSFAFSTSGTDAGQLRGRCRVEDLPAFIAKVQAEAAKHTLNRARMESTRSKPQIMPAGPAIR